MKYVIVIPDGCADEPQDVLSGKTPLQAAAVPNMDLVAQSGIVGSANHTPSHLPAGSAVANMSLLGYDPVANFTGRAPLEAAAQGIELDDNDWAIRCNLVTVTDQIMTSFTSGHISSNEAKALLETAQAKIGSDQFQFVPGVSYRNLLIYRDAGPLNISFSMETRTTPPHDLSDKTIGNDFPRGPGSEILADLMSRSVDWFKDHLVNQNRIQNNKLAATNFWLWGLGRRPKLESFASLHQLQGAMITAVDLLRGLAGLIGWDRIEVPGATGYTDTDYAAKGRYAVDALDKYDIVCVHIEAPDEASHEGEAGKKVAALEAIDQQIVAPLLDKLKQFPESRILITPDHPTYIRTKTHTHGDVPFTITGSGISPDEFSTYDEINAADSSLSFDKGFELMAQYISQKELVA